MGRKSCGHFFLFIANIVSTTEAGIAATEAEVAKCQKNTRTPLIITAFHIPPVAIVDLIRLRLNSRLAFSL